ncbi:hypothetical protein [uncultured Winogradskyella sp.]|uniref:hypothetical protein n=1 Tax=uncultured Winogradskyella sp. TaxID=395353 RepID=UPI002630A40D|nr:hypothetical protein [uncultured Winogradskyella sp.]
MIAAIYVYPNSLPHLFGEDHEAITLNLGGKYFYRVGEVRGHSRILDKERNSLYVDRFWPEGVSLISAIVGANGTGKSTILQAIKLSCQLVLEEDDAAVVIWAKDAGQLFYYTPYLTENRSDEDGSNVHNLSKLSQMSNDSKYENLDFSGHWEYHKSERLKRIILLVENEKYKKSLQELEITTFERVQIKFLKITKDHWNVSRNFVPFFESFEKLKEKEWTKNEEDLIDKLGLKSAADIKESREYQVNSRKSRLRLTILESIIKKVHSILENTGNKFLEEGYINDDLGTSSQKFKEITSTKEAFFWFIENAYFEIRKQKYYLPIDEIRKFTNLLLEFVEFNNQIDNWTILTVNFAETKTIIDAYQSFLLSFKEVFTYDEKIFMTFSPDKTLSTGEMSFYELFSALNYSNYRIEKKLDLTAYQEQELVNYEDFIVLLDEADLGFHPFWKRKYIQFLSLMLPDIFVDKKIQLIISTHDPLTLSDIPNNNIIYLKKENSIVRELGIYDSERPQKSFAANITDLLADSFFVDDGLIGDFAKDKIKEVINNLNFLILEGEIRDLRKQNESNYKDLLRDKEEQYRDLEGKFSRREKQYLKSVIEIIDEPILKHKMDEMYYQAFPSEIDKDEAIKRAKRILGNAGLNIKDLK